MDEQDDGVEAIRLCFSKYPGRNMWIPSCVPLDHHNNRRSPRAILMQRHKSGQGSRCTGRQFCSTRRTTSRHDFPVSDKPDKLTSG